MTPPVGQAPASKSRARKAKWSPGRDEFDSESMIAGVLLAILIWPSLILLLWLVSLHLGKAPSFVAVDPNHAGEKNFEINIVEPDEFLMPQKPKQRPQQFVEVNPDAPENMPDDTANFGARNQQAAQEKPNPDANGDRAATEGKKDFQSNQIVSGQLTPPTETPPPAPAPTPEVAQALAQAQAEVRKAQDPLSGYEKRIGDNPEGFGMNEAKASDNATADADKKVEGQRDTPLTVGATTPAHPRIDPRKPMPRVYVDKQRVRPAIFAENKVGTHNIGLAGIDSRWSNYGAYLQRLVDTVQIQFENLVEHSGVFPPSGTMVTIHFRLDKTGAVTEIIDSKSTGGSQAEAICKSAITTRAPYGQWTDDMIALLGDSQDLTFCFFYGTP